MDREETADLFELQDTNLWMKSEEELNEKWLASYSDVIPLELFEEAKRNTVRIAERARGVKLDRSVKLPYIEDAEGKLLEFILAGFKRRRLPKGDPVYLGRIKEEYDLICSKGFASYFVIQKMMTDEARRISKELLGYGDGSEAVGPGRGSAVGALTCYCLGITDVNPIEHDLLFSRFLSPARGGKQMKIRFTIDPVVMDEDLAKDCPFDVPIERK
jgi:DNA polymerase III alpha subunit